MVLLPLDRSPTDEELSLVLADYVRFDAKEPEAREAHERAFDDVISLVWDRPEDAWRFILLAAAAKLPLQTVAFIAAGPLEDVLSHHGDLVIHRIEMEFARNPGFAAMLSCVWRGGMSARVWVRVQALLAQA